jgi:hypothetical protein
LVNDRFKNGLSAQAPNEGKILIKLCIDERPNPECCQLYTVRKKQNLFENKSHGRRIEMSDECKKNHTKVEVFGNSGMIWIIGWLFTIGYTGLSFWKAVLALLIWPYYLGVFIQ